MTDQLAILAKIDEALERVMGAHCVVPTCGAALRPDGPSPWWCNDLCQRNWITLYGPLRPLWSVPDGQRWPLYGPPEPAGDAPQKPQPDPPPAPLMHEGQPVRLWWPERALLWLLRTPLVRRATASPKAGGP